MSVLDRAARQCWLCSMLSPQQQADSIALVKMILDEFWEADPETSERSYSVLAHYRLTPRHKPRTFPLEVWAEVERDFEKRGYVAFINKNMLVVNAP